MKTLHFHGSLKTLCPEPIQVEAVSVAEAISYLRNHPAFIPCIGNQHTVRIDGFESYDALYSPSEVQEIHIHPTMAGAGRNGWTQVIIGAIIVVAAVATAGGAAGLFTAAGGLSGAGSVALMGVSMMLGGILQLLAPQPSVTSSSSEKGRYLGGLRNTVAIGTRIPIIYGTRKVWGHYLSFDIDTNELNQTPNLWYASSFTDYSENTSGNAPD